MNVLVGETRSAEFVSCLEKLGWGRMWTVGRPKLYRGEPWGFDSNAFSWWRRGLRFDSGRYLDRLAYARNELPAPYLNVVPDIVGGGKNSLYWSLHWIPHMPPEWPNYLCVQDGMNPEMVRPHFDQFDGIFLGGTDAFKSTALAWSRLAHEFGLPFHYGRAGTPRKIRAAKLAGADSLDSSFPLWTRDRFYTFIELINGECPQGDLFESVNRQ